MHGGRLDTDSAAARVFNFLRANEDYFFSSLELTLRLSMPAISTRISEIRAALPKEGEWRVESFSENRRWYYRATKERASPG
jgi:hypothetical protein